MKDFLVLKLQAPLMSFGAVIVDNFGYTSDMPGLSTITGLIGNALGYYHGDIEKLHLLQKNIEIGVRCIKRGQQITDYQTVDFSQSHLPIKGWTTYGRLDQRKGGPDSKSGTHIRYRDYWADSAFLVVITIKNDTDVSLTDIKKALINPARPLFIGRKTCLPTAPIFYKELQSPSIKQALLDLNSDLFTQDSDTQMIWYPTNDITGDGSTLTVYDIRNWTLGIHTGSRLIKQEVISS